MTPSTKERRDRWVILVTGFLWVGSVGYGMKVLSDYRNTPGRGADPSLAWPSGSALPRASGQPTLIMMAHPECPCTRASLDELNLIMNRLQGRLSTIILFVKPQEFADGWEKTDSWKRARQIPGATVLTDLDGAEARRFHGYTSGQVLLYGPRGNLLYNGGITAGRGHEGENDGRRDVIALASGEKAGLVVRKVFGCALFSSTDGGGS